jgi:chorismate mutase
MSAPADPATAATPEPRDSDPAPEPTPAQARLAELRERIRQIDRELIGLIAERVALAREVGAAKRELGIPTLDPAREAAVVRNAGEAARELGVGDEDVRYIFWHLIGLSRRAQMEGE